MLVLINILITTDGANLYYYKILGVFMWLFSMDWPLFLIIADIVLEKKIAKNRKGASFSSSIYNFEKHILTDYPMKNYATLPVPRYP